MGLAGKKRGCAKEISLVNVIKDFVIGAFSGLRNFHATLSDQIKRIARLAFAKDYFAGFLADNIDFRRDPFDHVAVHSLEQSVIVESFDRSSSLRRFHPDADQPASDEVSEIEPLFCAYFKLARTPRT